MITKNESLKELSKKEMIEIIGGSESWLFRLGRAAHEAYDKLVDAIKEEFNSSDSTILGPTGNRYPGL
jgi:bacteriocin-like protein